MTTQKIYIRLIDGTNVWVPIIAKLIQGDQFKILENPEYDDLETNELYEFFPGDKVELEQHVFKDGSKGKVAKKLISKGQWTDRDYNEFKFKATLGQLSLDKETANKYRNEIERVKKEKNSGKYFYPSLLDTVEKLDNLRHGTRS